MKIVAVLFVFYLFSVSFACAVCPPYRGTHFKNGNFPSPMRGKTYQ